MATAITPLQATAECDRLLSIIECARRHPPLPEGRHRRAVPAPAGLESIYGRVFRLYEEAEFSPFAEPVNAIAQGIPHYYRVIEKPMSLRTVLDDMVAGRVTNVEQALAAVQQIQVNCRTFNGDQNEWTMLCERMVRRLADELRPPTAEEQARLTSLAEVSDGDVMQQVFHLIKAEAPHAVEADGENVDLANIHAGLLEDAIKVLERHAAM